jgi:hypothetical protein
MKRTFAVLVFVLGTLMSASGSAQSIGPDGKVLPAYSGRSGPPPSVTPPPVVTPPPPTLPAPTPAPAAAPHPAAAPVPAPPAATVTPPTPAPATIITPAVAPAPVTKVISVVPDGTEVDLKLAETISSARAMEGQRIRFTVAKDVAVDGYVVIQTGALAIGTVTKASPKKWAGRSGKLEMSLQNVTTIDGTKIDLAGTRGGSGDSHVGRMVTGIVITSIFTLGGSALFLLMHGKDLVIPEGSAATTYTIGTAKVASSQLMVARVNP